MGDLNHRRVAACFQADFFFRDDAHHIQSFDLQHGL
jgi:hypothetical protein